MVEFDAVVTDLDGTVIRRDGTVSGATVRAAAALAEQGVPLVAATARTPSGIRVVETLLPYVSLAVCCSGAIGYRPATGEQLWRDRLSLPAASDLTSSVLRCWPQAGLATYDGVRWRMTPRYQAVRSSPHKGPTAVVDRDGLLDGWPCAMAICHPSLTADELIVVLTRDGIGAPDVTFHRAGVQIVEVTAGGVDKGSGVHRACVNWVSRRHGRSRSATCRSTYPCSRPSVAPSPWQAHRPRCCPRRPHTR